MKTNILVAGAIAGSLSLAGAAHAQVLGGTVGGAVNGTVGGALGAPSLPSTPALPSTSAAPPSPRTLPPTAPSVGLPSANASAQGSANANANAGPASANAGIGASAGLDTLATGMMVQDASGRAIGKVSKVVRSAKGTVESVLVAGADGARRTIRLAPDSLSVNGQVVTTTQANGGVSR